MAVATRTAGRIESLLSARLFLNPQLADDRLYFVSDIAGRLSLYRMDAAGGVPEPLLPPGIALQNPELLGGYPFYVLPDLDRIVVMLDTDGDEVYQPCVIPLAGGFPEPLNEGSAARHLVDVDGRPQPGTSQPSPRGGEDHRPARRSQTSRGRLRGCTGRSP
jgi:hypothetical protein